MCFLGFGLEFGRFRRKGCSVAAVYDRRGELVLLPRALERFLRALSRREREWERSQRAEE